MRLGLVTLITLDKHTMATLDAYADYDHDYDWGIDLTIDFSDKATMLWESGILSSRLRDFLGSTDIANCEPAMIEEAVNIRIGVKDINMITTPLREAIDEYESKEKSQEELDEELAAAIQAQLNLEEPPIIDFPPSVSGLANTIFCPHCGGEIEVFPEDIKCTIFRHAIDITTGKQISSHASRRACAELLYSGSAMGCGKPFRYDGTTVKVCGYI